MQNVIQHRWEMSLGNVCRNDHFYYPLFQIPELLNVLILLQVCRPHNAFTALAPFGTEAHVEVALKDFEDLHSLTADGVLSVRHSVLSNSCQLSNDRRLFTTLSPCCMNLYPVHAGTRCGLPLLCSQR